MQNPLAQDEADIISAVAGQTLAGLGLSINQFAKTVQGRQLIESQALFCLNAHLYQGYNGRPVPASEDTCTDAEIENCRDVDGTKSKIVFARRQRLDKWDRAIAEEQEKKEDLRIDRERKRLELDELQRRAGVVPAPAEAPVPVAADPSARVYACERCEFETTDKRKLQGHKMGAHKK